MRGKTLILLGAGILSGLLIAHPALAQVAPGIAEALIATAMGLFAAIPAVVFYNRYAHDVDRLANRYETFMEEFSNILQRQSYSLRRSHADAAARTTRGPTAGETGGGVPVARAQPRCLARDHA